MEINKVLYISYDGLLDQLGPSQIIPYLKELSSNGIKFIALTFEKTNNLAKRSQIYKLEKELNSFGIIWKRLKYHKSPAVLSTFFDVLFGCVISFLLIKKEKIKIIHSRSYVAALIAIVLQGICRVRFIFDMRGFWADERVEAGIWKRDGYLYSVSKYFEKKYLLKSDEIISLTETGKREIEKLSYLKNNMKRITVIPTCVDIVMFNPTETDCAAKINLGKNIEGKFILIYIGSLSTWYMQDEMLKFFEVAQNTIDNSCFLILTKEEKFLRNNLQNERMNVSIISAEHNLVPYYLSIAKAGLAFYKPGYSRKACCPTKLGEYLASGLPVIINTGIGDCDEIISGEKVGVIINDFSLREYKRSIEELRVLLSEGDALRHRCMGAAEKYLSLDMGVERYLKIYRRLNS